MRSTRPHGSRSAGTREWPRPAGQRRRRSLPAIEKLTGTSLDELSAVWHASIRETYRPLDLTDVRPRGRALITDESGGGEINLGPALSPDGTRLRSWNRPGRRAPDGRRFAYVGVSASTPVLVVI